MSEDDLDPAPSRMEKKSFVRTSASERFYLPALDGVRTVAFLLVFGLHAVNFASSSAPLPGLIGSLLRVFSIGEMGVPLFFVLSAYLVTKLLLIEREKTGRIDIRAFLIRRTLRIWPLYYAYILVAGLLLATLPTPTPYPFFTSAKLSYVFFMGDVYHSLRGASDINIVWSLGVEEKFYLFWPALMAVLTGTGRIPVRTLGWMFVGLGFVSTLLFARYMRVVGVLWFPTNHLMAFGFGMVIADAPPTGRREIKGALIAFLASLTAVYLATEMLFGNDAAASFDSRPRAAIRLILGTIICAGFVYSAINIKKGVLVANPVVQLGKRSYGAYLFHIVPLIVLSALVAEATLRLFLLMTLALPLTIGAAYLSYRYFETPFLRLKSRFERVASRPV